MKIWMIFVQEGDEATWLEAAWDDEMTAENNEGWQKVVDGAKTLCAHNNYEYRILEVEVGGVYEAFAIPKVKAESVFMSHD
jgi:hypothetical protein